MPRTRRDLEREAKIDEVLEVAEDQLLAGGFESLSVAGVARELGIAQNAVYWYFPSRDHLFVATLERILARVLTTGKKPSHDDGPAVLALWFVDRLGELQSLLAAMHDRAQSSPTVAKFRDRVRGELRATFLSAITPLVAPSERDLTADAFIVAAEGALVQGLEPRKRTRLLRFLLTRLLPTEGSGQQ